MKKVEKSIVKSLMNILEDLSSNKIDKYEALAKLDRIYSYYKNRYKNVTNIELIKKARQLVEKYGNKSYREFRRRYSHKINKILNPNKKITDFI